MRHRVLATAWFLAASALAFHDASADPRVASLRTECGFTDPDPCYETTAEVVTWIEAQAPTASDPVLVDVGPGAFSDIVCSGWGHATFRGSGRTASRFVGTSTAVSALNCDDLTFQDLTLEATGYGILWSHSGRGTWQGVDVVANRPWLDYCATAEQREQLFSDARLRGKLPSGTPPLAIGCTQWNFLGGEIVLSGTGSPSASASHVGMLIRGGSSARFLGTTLRVVSGDWAPTASVPGGAFAVRVGGSLGGSAPGNPVFEMHSGIINIDMSGVASASVTAVDVIGSASRADTAGAAYILRTGASGGIATRIANPSGASVAGAFLWQAGTEPPSASPGGPSVKSVDGADLFVETDCSISGVCDGTSHETHLMIMNPAACPGSDPWFNSAVGRCRSTDN